MRHLPNLKEFTGEEILALLGKAAEIKASPGDFRRALDGESLAMLFQKTSTRTRVSFEVGMTELGGHALHIDWRSSNFALSGIDHETEYLSRNVSCIMARLLRHRDLQSVIAASQVPVINGCCEKFHPCQALTDIFTIQEHWPDDIRKAHLLYTGVQNNVSNSLVIICDKLGLRLTLATPPPASDCESLDADVQGVIAKSSQIAHVEDPRAAVAEADFIYTDTWIDMQHYGAPDIQEKQAAAIKRMLPYQVNAELLQGLDLKIMHDMPIHAGFEITEDLPKDPRSIIYQQAANRLHAQKGLLHWLYHQSP